MEHWQNGNKIEWIENGYGTDMEWVRNGYRTDTEQECVWNGNRTRSVKRSLLGFFWPVLYQYYHKNINIIFNLDGRQFYSPKSHIANLVCLVLAGESYIEVVLKVKARVIRGNNTTHFIHICSAELWLHLLIIILTMFVSLTCQGSEVKENKRLMW